MCEVLRGAARTAPHFLRLPVSHAVDAQREGKCQRGPVWCWSRRPGSRVHGDSGPSPRHTCSAAPCLRTHARRLLRGSQGAAAGPAPRAGRGLQTQGPGHRAASAPSSHPLGWCGEGARGPAALWSRRLGAWRGPCRGNGRDASHRGGQSPGRPPPLRPVGTDGCVSGRGPRWLGRHPGHEQVYRP